MSVAVVYGTISTNGYYYTKVLSDLFLDTPFNDKNTEGTIKTFRSSSDVKDFWKVIMHNITFAFALRINSLHISN
jgi:hypothetical protein